MEKEKILAQIGHIFLQKKGIAQEDVFLNQQLAQWEKQLANASAPHNTDELRGAENSGNGG